MPITIIISREDAGQGAAVAVENALAARCAGLDGVEVLLVPHLYHLPEESPVWAHLASLRGTVVVASWLHPRPAEWLLRRHGVAGEHLHALSLSAGADECFAAAQSAICNSQFAICNEDIPDGEDTPASAHCKLQIANRKLQIGTCEAESEIENRKSKIENPPRWFPVVDLSRCANCKHCLQFCLFGVYAEDAAGRVTVRNPDRCKPGCPACSRVCPEGAIIFPLYDKDEAIAGAPGLFVAPDPAARRMFYTRTGKTCPVCGGTPKNPGATAQRDAAGLCPECARPAAPPAPPAPEDLAVLDAIDSLIADLDDLTRRRS